MNQRGKILTQKHIARQDLRDNPDRLYVFGDNMEKFGKKGQAREMRGESNAVGIPTKWFPGNIESDFFKDSDLDFLSVRRAISQAFAALDVHLKKGKDIVWPEDGIGTGLAQLPQRAPSIHKFILQLRRDLETG